MTKRYTTNADFVADHVPNGRLPAGSAVYRYARYDYGSARDDTRFFKHKHISVTLKEDGGYPFFTLPRDLLDEGYPRHG